MYFVKTFNYEEERGITKQRTWAQFCSIDYEVIINYAQYNIPHEDYSYMAIIEMPNGAKDYSHPSTAFEWSEAYDCWVWARPDSMLYNLSLTYS